jgi:putative secretion ATPase (PEP-CTERM system associated)
MYEEHFGFSAKPFQISPDAAFFYPSKEHRRALSFLEYGLGQADGFIVLTGAVGTGKTTLVQALVEDLDSDDILVANLETSHKKEDENIQFVAASFGIDSNTGNKALLLRDLEKFFVLQAENNRRVLLIVDEAQNIPRSSVEELRMLSNFQRNGKPLVQIFLLGQAEFRTTLLSEGFEQLRQRVIATYHLNPLDESETCTYIEHRLSCVNWTNKPRFLEDAFHAIHQSTGGVPRRINNLCDRILLYLFLEDSDVVDAAVVNAVADEIGGEMVSGSAEIEPRLVDLEPIASGPVMNEERQSQPLESIAKGMFDKAKVQQRLSSLERAVDGLGATLKPEIAELREEIMYLRLVVEEAAEELRSLAGKGKRSA